MAVSFTYTPPLAQPIDLSVNRTAGAGTWEAGTYKFRVQTGNQNLYSATGVASVVSDEFIIDVQANDSLTFDFTPVDSSAVRYQLFFEKEGHSTSGDWEWINVNQGNDAIADLPKTFTKPYHPWYNYTMNPFHFYPYKPMGLALDKGWFNLEITGDGNFTIEDINDYLRANAADQEGILWIDGRDNALILMGNIIATSYGVGTLTMEGITFFNMRPFDLSSDLKLDMNNCLWVSGNRNMSSTLDKIRNFEITNSEILSDTKSPSSLYCYVMDGNTHIIKNSVLNRELNNSTQVGDYIGAKTKLQLSARLQGTFENLELQGGAYWVKYEDGLINNCKIGVDLNSYIFLAAANTDYTTEFRDCQFISFVDQSYQTLSWNIGDRIPLSDLFWKYPLTLYHFQNTTGTSKIIFTNTVDLTIKDNDNNYIEGVDVEIKDVSGSVVYTGSTDVTGSVNTNVEILRLEAVQNMTARGYNEAGSTKYEYNPFTMSFSKDGYQTETMTLNIQDPVDNTIVLNEIPSSPGTRINNAIFNNANIY